VRSTSAIAEIRRDLAVSARALVSSFRNTDLARAQLAFVAFSICEWASFIALMVFAFDEGGVAAVGVISLIQLIPAAVIAPLGSVLGDRFRRERVFLLAEASMCSRARRRLRPPCSTRPRGCTSSPPRAPQARRATTRTEPGYLKRPSGGVETPWVKTCPHCQGEIRDSVVRCTHCRRSLRDDEPGGESRSRSATASTAAPRVVIAAPPSPVPFVTPTVTAPPRATWAPPPASPLSNVETRRSMPETRRAWGPDMWMLWAGMAATAAGVLAYLAVKEPWAHLTITQAATDFVDGVVVEVTVRGQTAFVGAAGSVLAIALAAFGVLWFFYGFQRGWSMPGILNPALAILVTFAGIVMTALSSMVWFVWEDAMILRSGVAGLTTREMTRLLDQQPAPLVEIERMSGLISFGGMMVLGLFAACLAWWAYRRRG
jgi:hypothetical protein